MRVNCTKHVGATDNWQAGGRHWRALEFGHHKTVQDGSGVGVGVVSSRRTKLPATRNNARELTVAAAKDRKGSLVPSVVCDKQPSRIQGPQKLRSSGSKVGETRMDPLSSQTENQVALDAGSFLCLLLLSDNGLLGNG